MATAKTAHKRTALLLLPLVVVVCFALINQAEGYPRRVADVDNEEEDGEEEDDTFDFMSDKLLTKETPSKDLNVEETVCDAGTGQCTAEASIKSVIEKGLVTTKPRAHDILREHSRAASPTKRAFQGETLGYVTPWNGRGYDFARKFRAKFTYISPVWLQIREDAKTKSPIITGTHDIDRQWVQDVKGDSAPRPRIVPRVMYERNRLSHTDVPIIIQSLIDLAKSEAFDGFVFEIPVSAGTLDLLMRMGDAFHDAGILLLLVLVRASNDGRLPVTPGMMDQLEPYVHRYSMNAYDFQTSGPNAPYQWIQGTLDRFREKDRKKILMGIPFYGYDNSDAIVGDTHLDHLRDYKDIKIRWDTATHECHYRYDSRDSGRRMVYYPCLQFIQDRLKLFTHSGVAGSAIWELGQGLEYFYDLL